MEILYAIKKDNCGIKEGVMSILDSFYGVVYGTLLVIVSLKSIILLQNFINIVKVIREKEERLESRKNKRLNIKEIDRLTDYEYILFCEGYFKELGYENFGILNNKNTVKEIMCRKEDKKVLLRCSKESVDSEVVLDFIGAMIKNNIFEGIIVYCGKVEAKAIKISEGNKNKFSIVFVDIEEILKTEANKEYSIIEGLN